MLKNPTEEDNSTEEERPDGTVDIGADKAHDKDAENIKTATTLIDGG